MQKGETLYNFCMYDCFSFIWWLWCLCVMTVSCMMVVMVTAWWSEELWLVGYNRVWCLSLQQSTVQQTFDLHSFMICEFDKKLQQNLFSVTNFKRWSTSNGCIQISYGFDIQSHSGAPKVPNVLYVDFFSLRTSLIKSKMFSFVFYYCWYRIKEFVNPFSKPSLKILQFYVVITESVFSKVFVKLRS